MNIDTRIRRVWAWGGGAALAAALALAACGEEVRLRDGARPASSGLAGGAGEGDAASDRSCLALSCDPAADVCAARAAPDGAACDDGDPCTTGERCLAGECQGGRPRDCDDDDPCTVEWCESARGCAYAPRECDDGEFCTADRCRLDGLCAHVPVLDGTPCGDGGACVEGRCETVTAGRDEDPGAAPAVNPYGGADRGADWDDEDSGGDDAQRGPP